MDNFLRVCMDCIDGSSQIAEITQGLSEWQRFLSLQKVFQCSPCHQRHDQIELRAILAKIEDRNNVVVLELKRIASLAAEALDCCFLIHIAASRKDHLEGYLAHLKGIAGPVDGAHATQTQERLNAIPASHHRFREETLAIRFLTFKRARWIVSTTPAT